MMSASPYQEETAPPQPPLPPSDPAFSPPAIVNSIDPEYAPQSLPLRQTIAEAARNLSARVTAAVTPPKPSYIPHPPPAALLFGDSITAHSGLVTGPTAPGWSSLLREAYADRAEVFLRGFSGYNTRWALHILPRLVAAVRGASLRALVIFFGANDAARPGDAQYVPLDEYKRNLGRLVAFVRELPGGVQPMLVTPPPVTTFWEGDEETRSTERTAIYAEACVEAGRRLGVPVLNLHDDMVMAEGGKGQFLCDGLHLSAKGNRFMYERLVDMFRGCVPDLCPDLLKPNAPLSKDIDPLDPTKALGESSLV